MKIDQYCTTLGGRCYFFLCRVLLGDIDIISPEEAPQVKYQRKGRPIPTKPGKYYDSLMRDKILGPPYPHYNEFVVYDRRQVYPEYLVEYSRENINLEATKLKRRESSRLLLEQPQNSVVQFLPPVASVVTKGKSIRQTVAIRIFDWSNARAHMMIYLLQVSAFKDQDSRSGWDEHVGGFAEYVKGSPLFKTRVPEILDKKSVQKFLDGILEEFRTIQSTDDPIFMKSTDPISTHIIEYFTALGALKRTCRCIDAVAINQTIQAYCPKMDQAYQVLKHHSRNEQFHSLHHHLMELSRTNDPSAFAEILLGIIGSIGLLIKSDEVIFS